MKDRPTDLDSDLDLDIREAAVEAERRIRSLIRETPLEHSPFLSRECDGEVFLKLENHQITGSFKIRGAANRLLSLTDEQRERGVVTASTGNHGAAVVHLLGRLGCPGTVVVPRGAAGAKVDRLQRLGAELEFHGDDCVQSELHARTAAEQTGRVFISPYNDAEIIAGQGTVGLEIERQLDGIDSVLVPVGGGGLIAGIAGVLQASNPAVEIVGCQPERSPVMAESVTAGRIVELASKETLSDATAGGIEPEAITFPICRRLVDRFILVGEREIRDAIRLVLDQHHLLIEGAAALSVAAFLRQQRELSGRRVVLILSGGVIGLDTLRGVLG